MIKSVMCIRRKPGMSVDEFLQYWQHQHAELIKDIQQDLGILRYVQSSAVDHPLVTLAREVRNGPEPFDGIGEAWYESVDALAAAAERPAGQLALARLLEDEYNFVDLANSPFWLLREKQVF